MEHLCIGSYIRILTSCAIPKERKFDPFCEKIMLALCPPNAKGLTFHEKDSRGHTISRLYDCTNFSKIHSSSQNLNSEVVAMATQKNPKDIERYFIEKIIPILDNNLKEIAVYSLKRIILNDQVIKDFTQLGTIHPFTKNELRCQTEFVLSEFLTDIFIYAVKETDNTYDSNFTKSIKKGCFDGIGKNVINIRLIEQTIPIPPKMTTGENSKYKQLSENDKKLLKDFQSDFDDRLKKCIESTQPDVWLFGCSSSNASLYDKWKTNAINFDDMTIRANIFGTIAILREFCDTLDPSSSFESEKPPRILKLELRNFYVKIHLEKYAGEIPYNMYIDDWDDGEDYF